MKNIFRILLGFGILMSLTAFAGPPQAKIKSKIYILDYEKFQRLQLSQKKKYIKDIQAFLVRGDFAKDPSRKTSWLSLFIETSHARDLEADAAAAFEARQEGAAPEVEAEPSACIFAGYLLTMKKMRKSERWYCPKPPPSKDCGKDEVACNPLIFGKAVNAQGKQTDKLICISGPFTNATEKCQDNSGEPADIVAALDNDEMKSQWDAFQNQAQTYCGNPLAFNQKNCETIAQQTELLQVQIRARSTAPKGAR